VRQLVQQRRAEVSALHPFAPNAGLANGVEDDWLSRMPRIPLEDNFTDVIGKAQRGLQLNDDALATKAEVTAAELKAIKGGEIRDHVIRSVAKALGLEREALLALARREWYPEQPVFPRGFAMFNTPHEDMTVNAYLVWDGKTRQAAAFDTGSNAQPMLDLVAAEHLTLRYIFLTHTHDDHIADLPRLASTGAEVWASELEPAPHAGAKTFQENAHFHLGELSIKTLFTWGHSPGQTSYYVTGLAWPLAIVGDSLFASSMGGGLVSYDIQLRNNRQKLLKLPLDTVFACGHGPLTTLKQEKKHNPFFAR
jgi:hydroxyacylglutathione hydrolase